MTFKRMAIHYTKERRYSEIALGSREGAFARNVCLSPLQLEVLVQLSFAVYFISTQCPRGSLHRSD